MTLVEFTLHDDRKVAINPQLVAFVAPVGGSTSIPLTRINLTGADQPVDVRESFSAVVRTLTGRREG